MPTLHWIGKEKVINHHLDVPYKVLDYKYTYSNEENTDNKQSENKIIHGDNLEALKSLLPQYEGKVDCIYIDPPYNTGNESWVYNDNVNDPKIRKWLGDVVGKEGEDLSRHDKWLCMMYPRLKLLQRLLADTGLIFISIDDNEQANLKLLCDEIFGAGNFIRNIIWHKKYASSNDAKGIPDSHDFLVCYAKSNLYVRNLLPRTDKQNKLYKYDSEDGMGLWRSDNLSVKTYSANYDYPITNPITLKEYFPPAGRSWMSNKAQIEKWVMENRIFFGQNGKGAPQLKRYLNEVQQGIVPTSYWSYEEVNHTDGAKKELKLIFTGEKSPFPTPKPSRLLERVLQIATQKENSIILDSFAGSGTTAHAVLNLNKKDGGNRKFILIEMEDYAETITAERVRRVIDGYGDTEGAGGDFNYYTLGEPLLINNQYINENVPLDILREYIFFTETSQVMPVLSDSENDYLLGSHNLTDYYFYYKKDSLTTLDDSFLGTIKQAAESYLIYADICTLSDDELLKHGILLRKYQEILPKSKKGGIVMELKTYQKKVLADLGSYLNCLNDTGDLAKAYEQYWNNKDVAVGFGGVPAYQNNIEGTPHICFKVPTGGGKTFLASSAIKPIYESIGLAKKMVVWLVPSNTILEQTMNNLKDPRHPYRQAINRDFSGAVQVYSKDELQMAQNFNPTTVLEQLSIAVLSYDSLRSNTKDNRKAFQQNSNLAQFAPHYQSPETLIEDIDETALMQVLNQLNPVIIVDESHNATSDLSVEMLKNLNPSFILDLTATPRKNSNVISYADAKELKKENMIKLPVIVYNRPQKQDVLIESIAMRDKLEAVAIEEEKNGGSYIRPIVLFQAQPRNKEDSETFDKIKTSLVDLGIPENQIAIKTAEINQIKNIDIMSKDCEIRYIITVNALKEGWDCPFAYILATLANKTSKVDVEQIVGRILRQPHAKKAQQSYLNLSYVITSSNDFKITLNSVVEGLNQSGFNADDVRIDTTMELLEPSIETEAVQQPLEPANTEPAEDDYFADVDLQAVKQALEATKESPVNSAAEMLEHAKQQGDNYTEQMEEESKYNADIPFDLKGNINQLNVQPAFLEEIQNLYLPQFYVEVDGEPNFFHEGGMKKLEKEHLTEGFTLSTMDANISNNLFGTGEVVEVDIDFDQSSKTRPKYRTIAAADERYYRLMLETKAPEEKREKMVGVLVHNIAINAVDDEDLRKYIERVIEHFSNDQLSALIASPKSYARKIKDKIQSLMEEYQETIFNLWCSQERITCEKKYSLPLYITPMKHSSNIAGSLYEAERDDLNSLEHEVITKIASLENVRWWHRIIERNDFYINGFVNHYPDFLISTKNGKYILLETKGEHLEDYSNSTRRAQLGRQWESSAGRNEYRYFMVFKENESRVTGAVNIDTLIDTISRL